MPLINIIRNVPTVVKKDKTTEGTHTHTTTTSPSQHWEKCVYGNIRDNKKENHGTEIAKEITRDVVNHRVEYS